MYVLKIWTCNNWTPVGNFVTELWCHICYLRPRHCYSKKEATFKSGFPVRKTDTSFHNCNKNLAHLEEEKLDSIVEG